MKEEIFDWLRRSPILFGLAIAFVALQLLTPATGSSALNASILSGLIAIPAALERWFSRHKRDEWLSDIVIYILLGVACYLYIIPGIHDLAHGSKTIITDDYHVRKKYRSHSRHSYSSYDFSSRYRLEIRGIRGQFPIDSADYEALNHPPLPRIRVEYWPKSGIIRRLTINPTEENP
ncbi:hypothetical protein ACF3OJ_01115 [Cardiobacterium hominis]|uniref:Uncharacterized protein n=1 Tax=Cardiobacterium hominis TaxID=2718 RepID=A0A1C3H1J5_9GAMM|nr:hypothetical protein [Cardiobacterium hominis]SAM56905.1 hypothetical protein CHUV0807_0017 [Cardiobacterium hominis]